MFDVPEGVNAVDVPERRVHTRLRVGSGASIDLGEGYRGTVLNVSEGGLALQVAVTLTEHPHIPLIRFGLPISENRVEINGQISWVSESRTEVGIRFIDLQQDTRSKIRDWISLESSQGRLQRESGARGEGFSSVASVCHIRETRLEDHVAAAVDHRLVEDSESGATGIGCGVASSGDRNYGGID